MTVPARRVADVSFTARIRRWVEEVLPWYSPEAERRNRAYTADLEKRSKAAIISAQQVAEAYRKASERVKR